MNQAEVSKVVSKLRYNVRRRKKISSSLGITGRHTKLRKTVTALFKHERIELNYPRGDEARGYAERLISDAIRYGDCHKETFETANYWILEKQLVHKLFKVLVPRYQNLPVSYTKLWFAPRPYPGPKHKKCVLELRNNIYPPFIVDQTRNKNLIHNVLLEEARKEFRTKKYAEIAEKLAPPQLQEDAEVQELTENVGTIKLNEDEELGKEKK